MVGIQGMVIWLYIYINTYYVIYVHLCAIKLKIAAFLAAFGKSSCHCWPQMGRVDIPLGPDPGPETAEAFPRCAWCGDASKTVCGRCKVRAYCAPPFAKDATADGQEHPVSDDYRI